MELKYARANIASMDASGSNRTFMELKSALSELVRVRNRF